MPRQPKPRMVDVRVRVDESMVTLLRCVPRWRKGKFIREAIEKQLREPCPTCNGHGYLKVADKRDDDVLNRAACRISYVIHLCWAKVKFNNGLLKKWITDNWPDSNGDPGEQAGKFAAWLDER